jgi:hypothetical protein
MGAEAHEQEEHADARTDREARGAMGGSPPPGAFPRSVSPTVEEHPDYPIREDAHRGGPERIPASTSTVENPAEPPLGTGNNVIRQHETPSPDAADTSAARFISSLFHQRSASPSSGNGACSPGPMGTASHLGRTASSQSGNERSMDSPAVTNGEATENSTEGSANARGEGTRLPETNESSSNPPNGQATTGPPITDTTASSSIDENTVSHDAEQPHHPHPVYPTVIPAEHLERHARREAMLREAERRRERSSDGSEAGRSLSE